MGESSSNEGLVVSLLLAIVLQMASVIAANVLHRTGVSKWLQPSGKKCSLFEVAFALRLPLGEPLGLTEPPTQFYETQALRWRSA